MALQYITKDILTRTSGEALLDLPYDIAFIAGYDADMVKEDVSVRTYGEMVMARTGEFIGEAAYIDTAPTGTNCETMIQKNGSNIYSSGNGPRFSVGANTGTAGTLTTTTFVSGDRITFKVTQIGSGNAGQGVRITLKCRV